MRKLLFILGLCWTGLAAAQFTPGQVLTAAQLNSTFALYAPLAGATFTGPVAHTSLSASGAVSGVGFTNLLQPYLLTSTAATTYAPLNSPTFTGIVTIPAGAVISGFAPLASPTFTGSPVVPGYLTTASASLTYAPLASPTFTGTATLPSANIGAGAINGTSVGASTPFTGAFTTLSVTGNFTPSQTSGIVGTTTNNNANAGSVGEYLTNAGTGTGMTSTITASNVSLGLSPGDWDVECTATFVPAASTTVSSIVVGVNTSATLPAANTGGFNFLNVTYTTGNSQILSSPIVRISSAGFPTANCIVQATFGVSTMTSSGFIRARRVR